MMLKSFYSPWLSYSSYLRTFTHFIPSWCSLCADWSNCLSNSWSTWHQYVLVIFQLHAVAQVPLLFSPSVDRNWVYWHIPVLESVSHALASISRHQEPLTIAIMWQNVFLDSDNRSMSIAKCFSQDLWFFLHNLFFILVTWYLPLPLCT